MLRQAKLMVVNPVILQSARKHGIHDHDMLHAYRNPIRVFGLDDLTSSSSIWLRSFGA